MRLLIIGGTSFVGRHIVEAGLTAGDDVTLANRGRTDPGAFPDLPRRTIDRATGDLASLREGAWDATVDVSAYIPRHVGQLRAALGDRAGRYVLISTVSVYDRAGLEVRDEHALLRPAIRDTEDVTDDTYGGLKVACEESARAGWGDRATVVRPGIVAGPHDPTDRFTWWVRHLAAGGPVPVPDRPDAPVQVVDARDLGAFCHELTLRDTAGTYDATGEAVPLRDLVQAVARGTDADPRVEWVDPAWWGDRAEPVPPLIVPPALDGLFQRSSDRAVGEGLRRRQVEDTAAATWSWDADRGRPPLSTGPDPAQQRALVADWRATR